MRLAKSKFFKDINHQSLINSQFSSDSLARPNKEARYVCHKETHPSPNVSARLWRDISFAVARVDAARANPFAPDGRKPRLRETLCRYLAPARRGAGLLESLAGRFQLRIFVYHESVGAVT